MTTDDTVRYVQAGTSLPVHVTNALLVVSASSGDPGVPGTVDSGSAWQMRNRPTTGSTASVTKAAPGANKQLIVTSVTFAAIATVVSTVFSGFVEVIATPSNTVLFDAVLGLKGTVVGDAALLAQPLVLVAPVNETVVVRFSSGVGNLAESVAANGYVVSV